MADPDDEHNTLVVKRQPAVLARIRQAERSSSTLLGAAIVFAVLAAVALIVSWIGSGQVRLVGGIGSAVLGVSAVFLVALRHRRQLDVREDLAKARSASS